jgi:hypothetical protein
MVGLERNGRPPMRILTAIVASICLALIGCNKPGDSRMGSADDRAAGSVAGTGITSGEGNSSVTQQQRGTGVTATPAGDTEGSESTGSQENVGAPTSGGGG